METENSITITWHIDDVLSIDPSLSNDKAREVLLLVEKYHDCNYGISWETIEAAIGMCKDNQ